MKQSLPEFIRCWKDSELTERAGAQSHFNDLCDILNEPHPAHADPKGAEYTFEKRVNKMGDEKGFADVWMRSHFGWEYKGPHKDLKAAYQQLLKYREDLENPPLLVVCDFVRFEVHTNFTNTRPVVYRFTLDDLMLRTPVTGSDLSALEILRAVFQEPEKLKPGALEVRVTTAAADRFTDLKTNLSLRGHDSEAVAKFLMRILFCLFADCVGLLPQGMFRKMIATDRELRAAKPFTRKLKNLFAAMSERDSLYGSHEIRFFNGGLFNDSAVLDLEPGDLSILGEAAKLDWSRIEPVIFGTLFERILDEGKRAQLGAHYTSREDILLIVEPVIMAPLRRRWTEVKAGAEEIAAAMETASPGTRAKLRAQLEDKIVAWMEELSRIRILDPACGSGNFLYVALWLILDLWKEAQIFAADRHLPTFLPCKVHPSQLYGIETNVYAHELASVVVWIGYLQWQRENRPEDTTEPILRVLDNIRHGDAILAWDAKGNPVEPVWPEVDFIVGNPPFLGDKKMRGELGDKYVDNLRQLYDGRVPGGADLVTYWFEKARAQIEAERADRAGLIATQGIRGGANRTVLERILESGGIFMAWSDRPWIQDGAAVHVSIVGFDDGSAVRMALNGEEVSNINCDLSHRATNLTTAQPLSENRGIAFIGSQKGGKFDLEASEAHRQLAAMGNPNGRPNSDVIKPWLNASDLTGRNRNMWIIDFGTEMGENEAALYQEPFEYAREHIRPGRIALSARDSSNESWWRHQRPRPEMRDALEGKRRYIATARHSKHRIFDWVSIAVVPDSALVVFARDDIYFLGVLHSRPHEVWSRATGTQVREAESGFRYTPLVCFDPYPFPWPPGKEPEDSPQVKAIAEAARELVEQRDRWLNPPKAGPEELAKLTLTNLYNKRPKWLDNAHAKLDKAVFAAYGWPDALRDEEILERLLALNETRAMQAGGATGGEE